MSIFFGRRKRAEELAEEIESHLRLAAEARMGDGLTPAEAQRSARREFGNIALVTEATRASWGWTALEQAGQDIRYACRALWHNPSYAAAVVITLGLGIGANSAIFSLINSLSLRTLPGVAAPEQLVTVSSGNTADTGVGISLEPRWSYVFWKEIEQRASAFGGALAWSGGRFDLITGTVSESVDGAFVSGEFFKTLGVATALGRPVTAADDDTKQVAVISDALWRRRFGASSQVLGTEIQLDRVPFIVIGVMPRGFFGLEVGRALDIVVPLAAEPSIRGSQSFLKPPLNKFNYWLMVVLRVKSGQSLDTATGVLRGMQPQIRDSARPALPGVRAFEFLKEPFVLTGIGTGTSQLRRTYQRPLAIIQVVAALVLLIACANIANLQLARSTTRRHELSVRRALGASRRRLARQLFVESLVLAGAGAGVGLLLRAWCGQALISQISTLANPVTLDLSLDWPVVAFTMAVAVVTAVVFGMSPLFLVATVSPVEATKGRGAAMNTSDHSGMRNALIVVQVALSLVLVVLAGLFVQSFQRLAARPLGFDTHSVLVARVDTTRTAIKPPERGVYAHRLVDTVVSIPGVAHAAASLSTPVDGSNFSAFVQIAPEAGGGPVERVEVKLNFVTPAWFDVYALSVHEGRVFNVHDTDHAPGAAVVNDAFVRRSLGAGAVVGRTVRMTMGVRDEFAFPPKVIVGRVGDAIYGSLREDLQPSIYLPLAQWDLPIPIAGSVNLSLRAAGGAPAFLVPSVRAALAGVDQDLAIRFQTLEARLYDAVSRDRLLAVLSGAFAALALVLAGVGLFGVTSYMTARRRAEIGIRLALGATPGAIERLVLRRVLLQVGMGLLVGVVVSLWTTRISASLLYGVTPDNPATLLAAAALLGGLGALAGWLPARRATRVSISVALRCE